MLGHCEKYNASSSPPRLAQACHPTWFFLRMSAVGAPHVNPALKSLCRDWHLKGEGEFGKKKHPKLSPVFSRASRVVACPCEGCVGHRSSLFSGARGGGVAGSERFRK